MNHDELVHHLKVQHGYVDEETDPDPEITALGTPGTYGIVQLDHPVWEERHLRGLHDQDHTDHPETGTPRKGWGHRHKSGGFEHPDNDEHAPEPPADRPARAASGDSLGEELASLVTWMDADLDSTVSAPYREQPLAQDWARVTKVGEEAGEAIDALIGLTGQNPRKGVYGTADELLAELADVALAGLYAIQHFTKDAEATIDTVMARARHQHTRRAVQLRAAGLTSDGDR